MVRTDHQVGAVAADAAHGKQRHVAAQQVIQTRRSDELRITSYNVCYTKLLRVIKFQGFADGDVVAAIGTADRLPPRLRRDFRAQDALFLMNADDIVIALHKVISYNFV